MSDSAQQRAIFRGMLLALLALILVPALLPQGELSRMLSLVLFSLVLLMGVAATAEHPISIWIAVALALPALGLRWFPDLGGRTLDVVAHGTAFLLILLSAISILREVLRRRRVTQDTLYGSVCVYLLMGVGFSVVFSAVELLSPGSFALNNEPVLLETGAEQGISDRLIYYSLVTMTTLGYGDITPVNLLARRLAVVEAMLGQLYVAILVARLVALQVAHAEAGRRD